MHRTKSLPHMERTTSAIAVMVLASTPPLTILARARDEAKTQTNNKTKIKNMTKQMTYIKWAEMLRESDKPLVKAITPRLKDWVERKHGNLMFHMTQTLTGHGCFNAFLFRTQRHNTPICDYCRWAEDNSDHTLRS